MVASYREYASPAGLTDVVACLDDGGWTVEYLPWSPAQAVEWRGLATIAVLGALRANERIRLP